MPFHAMQPLDPALTRRVHIDAAVPTDIWREVVEHDRPAMHGIGEAIDRLTQRYPLASVGWSTIPKLMYRLVHESQGAYIDESDYLADQVDNISRAQMALLQRLYSWSHVACSTVITREPVGAGVGRLLHFRSLDWILAADLGQATRRFEYVGAQGELRFVAAGLAGMVGVVTGVKPGFSVAINWAPSAPLAVRNRPDPVFLTRRLLAAPAINAYDEAKAAVLEWRVSSPVFVSLCGVDDAAIIEFADRDRKRVRALGNQPFLAVTNHFVDTADPDNHHFTDDNKRFIDPDRVLPPERWYNESLPRTSVARHRMLTHALEAFHAAPEGDLVDRLTALYSAPPLLNFETCQWVAMRPDVGEMAIWRHAPAAA